MFPVISNNVREQEVGEYGIYLQGVYQERKLKQYILAIVGTENGKIGVGAYTL